MLMTNLFLAYAAVWAVLMGYLVSIAARQHTLQREIATLKALLQQKDQGR
jgi:CcmD family protein